ncbi:hypothetical protein QJS04_geneDACA004452 [Acorus gramineus]|uniref:Uncharacterized protein n=1 Tax=Acorus gramineus TaxID=55184 RepID=A0AAV9B1Q8_ACOGR|nr:hypothetical protein QJS04_geneDACA004452 [Acorus gramineus]
MRFSTEMTQVNDCDPRTAAMAFRSRLVATGNFYESLVRMPPIDMADILSQVDGYLRLEEDAALANRKVTTPISVTPTPKGGTTSKKPPPGPTKKGDAATSAGRTPRGSNVKSTPLTVPIGHVWKENRDKGFF